MTPVSWAAYLDGRLVRETAFVNAGPASSAPYGNWVPGKHRWLLDGDEITEAHAERLLAAAGDTPNGKAH